MVGKLKIRLHRPGDMGWITYRHGVLYHKQYGWNEEFEILVGRMSSDFLEKYKPNRERCFIAEIDGESIGNVFLTEESPSVARLRFLLVEGEARGRGVGSQLLKECIEFAKEAGYSKLVLWTNSILVEGRRLYKKNGFKMVSKEEHFSYGHKLIGENWEFYLK